MLLTAFVLAAGIAAAQAAPTPVPATPNPGVGSSLARFADNDWRQRYDEARRAHILANAQAGVRRRMALAERLDILISQGRCGEARNVSQVGGYADIREGVARVCDRREAAAPQG